MKINNKTLRQQRNEKLEQWHRWFAWRPVWLDKYPDKEDSSPAGDNVYIIHGVTPTKGVRVWLQFVERRAYHWVAVNHVLVKSWHYK